MSSSFVRTATVVAGLAILCSYAAMAPLFADDASSFIDDADRWSRYDRNLYILTVAPSSPAIQAMGQAFQHRKDQIVAAMADRLADGGALIDEVETAIAGHLSSVDDHPWTDEFAQDLVAALDSRNVDTSLLRVRASRSYRSAEFDRTLAEAAETVKASGTVVEHLYFEDGDFTAVADELTTKASSFQSQKLRVLGRGEFALTFDDGPHTGGRTTRVLDALRANGFRATFFQLGSTLSSVGSSSLTKRLTAEGHDVGVHGWYHATQNGDPFTAISSSAVRSDLTKARDAVQRTYGLSPVTFRAPYGEFRDSDFAILRDLGLTYVGWDIDTNDWQKKSPAALADEAIRLMDARGSGIVLMHDIQERTSLAIGDILEHMKRKGYRCVTIREKLGGGSPTPPTPPAPPAGGGTVAAGSKGVVQVEDSLNVRQGPSTDHAVVGTLAPGDEVTILTERDGWYQISSRSVQGWVSGRFVRVTAPPTRQGIVTVADSLNVRQGPSTSHAIVGALGPGERVIIVGERDGWYQISTSSHSGWVHGDFVRPI